jgi:hypothetical protein
MVRGDTYYVANGAYTTTNQSFSIADSGAAAITILGATAADHGPATGWSNSLGVDVSPAKFHPNLTYAGTTTGNNTPIWRFISSNWVVNGNNCTANQIRKSGQGFLIDDSVSSVGSSSEQSAVVTNSTEAVNVTLQCVEMIGAGTGSEIGDSVSISSITCTGGNTVTVTLALAARFFGPDAASNRPGTQIAVSGVTGGSGFNTTQAVVTGNPSSTSFTYTSPCTPGGSGGKVDGVYTWFNNSINTSGPSGNFVFRYLSIHDTGVPVHLNGGYNSLLSEYNYLARWTSNSTLHSDGYSWNTGTSASSIIRYNLILDGEGSAVFTPLNVAHVSNLSIYGNVIAQTSGNPFVRFGYGDGIFACINTGTTCAGMQFYNNTIANIKTSGGSGGHSTAIQALQAIDPSTWKVENNLWYNDDSPRTTAGMAVEDYNTLLNTTVAGGFTGTHDFNTTSGSSDPFVADTSSTPAITGFALSSEQVDAHLNDGVSTHSILAANDTDYTGTTRGVDGTWDRGAFESSGTSPIAVLSPASINFFSQIVSTTSSPQTVTLSDIGTATLTMSASLTGTNPGDFAISGGTCGSSISAGNSCTYTITFTPTVTGARSATLSITDNASGSPHTVALQGTGGSGSPIVSLTQTFLGFASQPIGVASPSQTTVLSNGGTATLTISSIVLGGTNSADFAKSTTCGATLAPNASCLISATFTPSAPGQRNAIITVTDNASGSPHVVTLQGNRIFTITGHGAIRGFGPITAP